MSDEIKNPNTEDEEYQPDLMTLEDEDGNEVTFEVIDALDHKGVHYLAVVEYTENEEDAEDAQLVILSVGEDDEGEYLDVVEDDETLLEVSKLFEQRLSDDYEIDWSLCLRIFSFPPLTRRERLQLKLERLRPARRSISFMKSGVLITPLKNTMFLTE